MNRSYEDRERAEFLAQIRAVESAPICRDDVREFDTYLRENCDLVTERIDWLIGGAYGKGSYDATRAVLVNKRMNRHAWLFQTIAALEFRIKSSQARKLWNNLDRGTQDTINYSLTLSISDAVREIEVEAVQS